MTDQPKNNGFIVAFLYENSAFLIAGSVIAMVWANWNFDSYDRFIHWEPFAAHTHAADEDDGHEAESSHAGDEGETSAEGNTPHDEHGLTLHFIITDLLMALFFAIAAKEVWESMLPGGALSSPRKAAMPLIATAGGVIGPAGLFLLGCYVTGNWFDSENGGLNPLTRGWAIPCATDIAFSYLFARFIFGPGHPAIAFLLLLAIADDAIGLIILAVAYPQTPLQPQWLLLTVAAIVIAIVMQKKLKLHSFWWYLLIPGVMSWLSFKWTGVHAALGLVPIIPFLPHAHTDLGIFAKKELQRHDTLNEFEHWWKNPVEIILGLFGLVNAGVLFSGAATGTVLVISGLLIGKPIGITLFAYLGQKLGGLSLPDGMNYRHVVTLGMVAGLGFTVALFVSTAAFPEDKFSPELLNAVKMGALLSFAAGPLGFALAKLLGIKPIRPSDDD